MVSRVEVIGVPMDLGADRRGVDMGPSAVRYAGLKAAIERLGIAAVDRGNIPVRLPESASPEEANAKYFPIIAEACELLAAAVADVVRAGGFPLVLGGDHSIAMGTLAGVTLARGAAPGVIWVDAHGDINTPLTSPSGNVHGMPVHFALEARSIAPERIVFIGLRDVDAGERRAIRDLGVKAFTMSDIDRYGMAAVIEEALAIAGAGADSLHVSFDMDGIDPSEAPGVGTPVRGGLSYREAHLLMEHVAASGTLGSLEITEINPILDNQNQTAVLAVELVLSALGKDDAMTFDREAFEERRRIFEDAGRATCPACGYPTIRERAAYEICSLCAWEDDGQDDNPHRPEGYHDYFAPDDVAGGPNHDYSLTEARENFAANLTSYRPADNDFESERAATDIKREIVKAYERAVIGLIDVDRADEDAQYLFNRLYGMNE